MSRSLRFACLLSLLCLVFPAAHADTILTFALTGDFAPVDGEPFGLGSPYGDIVIDTTTGTVVSFYVAYTENFAERAINPESFLNLPTPESPFLEFATQWYPGYDPLGQPTIVDIFVPVDTLVGYMGGPVCSDANPCSDYISSNGQLPHLEVNFADGQLTLAQTPEPSSLVLLSTAALGLAGALRRKLLPRRV